MHCDHDCLEVLTDVLAQIRGQIHVLHSCVCRVDDRLLLLRLAAYLCDKHSQLSENVRLENRTSQVDNDHEDDLRELLRAHLIATDDEHRVVEADEVEEDLVFSRLVALPEVVIAVVEIVGRDPGLVPLIA